MANNIKFGDLDVQIPSFDFKKIGGLITVIIVAITLFFSIYTIQANENGVVLRLGKYHETTMPGLHFIITFVDMVYPVKVDYQYKQEYGFQTLKAGVRTQYSRRNYSGESWMLTGDLNIAEVHWIVQYKIKNAANYLFNVRDVKNTIRDVSEATLRLMIGDRSFTEVIQRDRVIIANDAKQYMQKILDKYEAGIAIKMVQLQSVLPPEPVAIERINNAKGEAALFELILAEYKKAPEITKDRYFIETMNTIFTGNSNKVIVDTELENFLPMLNLKNKEKK